MREQVAVDSEYGRPEERWCETAAYADSIPAEAIDKRLALVLGFAAAATCQAFHKLQFEHSSAVVPFNRQQDPTLAIQAACGLWSVISIEYEEMDLLFILSGLRSP